MSAPTRTCWGCSREIAAPATLCDTCTSDAAAPDAAGEAVAPSDETERRSTLTSLSRRDLALMLLGAAAAGIVTVMLLMSRAVASPEAAAGPAAVSAGRVAAPASPPAPVATAAAAAAPPSWSSENRSQWVGNARKSAAFDLEADNRIQVWTRQVRPTLVVRCVSGSLDVFVVTDSAATIEAGTDDHTVTFGFDTDPDTTERWADSVDHDALFAPDGVAFAERLTRATTMRFRFSPHNAAPAGVRFSVSGLGALIEPVAGECGRGSRGS